MKGRWMLFQAEIKRIRSILPAICLETVLFALILLMVGVYAVKAVYGGRVLGEIKVGIVAQGEDPMTEMLIRFAASMDSVEDRICFERMSEAEAERQIADGEIYAAVLIPEGIVESILSGENRPALIWLGNAAGSLETEVFAELTRAGAQLLATAQAGIYAADALCLESGMPERIEQTEEFLNNTYLKYALGRTSLFRLKEVRAVKGVGLADYYGIALTLAFLTFAGLSFGRCIQTERNERKALLQAGGVEMWEQYLIEAAAFGSVFTILCMVVSIPVYLGIGQIKGSTFVLSPEWLLTAVVWFSLGVLLRLLLQITGNSAGGIGVCFAGMLGAMAVSGVWIPAAFLPVWAERIGNALPYHKWMEQMAGFLKGRAELHMVLVLLLQIVVFLTAGALLAALQEKAAQGKQRSEKKQRRMA